MTPLDDIPDTYRQVQVEGADSRHLVVLLARGLVKFLLRTRDALDRKDYEAKADALTRARAILSELHCSLDTEAGGELARNLRALYSHWYTELVEVDLQDDIQRLDYVLECAQKMADTWQEAYEACRNEQHHQAA
ncbi:MAG: flagellar export chaperone FliS [Armatimonadetes bacterium]|nr:flagellar export chaperone FliS [Armatimonadota bacterium]